MASPTRPKLDRGGIHSIESDWIPTPRALLSLLERTHPYFVATPGPQRRSLRRTQSFESRLGLDRGTFETIRSDGVFSPIASFLIS